MKRDPGRLAGGPFDVLVIGGGIYGAWIAYDAALRGLRTALIERDDWACATSSASSKLIHGGLRYLEYGQVGLVAKALRERGRLMRLAPHRVRGLRFLLPVWRASRTGRAALLAGLSAYDLLAGTRPALAAHRAYPADDLLARAHYLDPVDLVGGFAYGDASEDDARMTLELVAGALTAGAVAVNGAAATTLLRAGGRVVGARVRVDGADLDVRADVTVAAAGAAAGALVGAPAQRTRWTKGVHLVMPRLPNPEALLLTARSDQRVFFLIPWYGATLLGTTDTDYHGDPGAVGVEPADVDYLLREANASCPGLGWTRDDVRGAFAGLRVLQGRSGSASSVSREWELEEPALGLLWPVGGKLTSARVEAARTVDRIAALAGRRTSVRLTGHRPFPWAPGGAFRAWLRRAVADGCAVGLDRATALNAAYRFGTTLPTLHRLVRAEPTLAARIHPDHPFCAAEAVHAVRQEMAMGLRDVLRRRVPLAILARHDPAWIRPVAERVGHELGWDAARIGREIAELDQPSHPAVLP